MNHQHELVVINLCIVRIRLVVTFGGGVGAYLRLGSYPLLTAFVGPLVLEVGRR